MMVKFRVEFDEVLSRGGILYRILSEFYEKLKFACY